MTTILHSRRSRFPTFPGDAEAAASETTVSPISMAAIAPAQEQSAHLDRTPTSSRISDLPFLARFAVINLVGLALAGAAWADGLLFKPYEADTSGMCYLITALFGLALIAVARRDWQTVRWAGNALVYLGMVGTVLGLIMTVTDLTVDKAENFESFKNLISAIYVGSGTALYTNLIACVGYLWLGTNAHLLARQEV
jgi:hypothetical protein